MGENILTKKDLARLVSSCLGQIVSCTLSTGFRPNQKAEIIGWCMIDDKPYFTIRFKDNETTHIPVDSESFKKAGYVLRAS